MEFLSILLTLVSIQNVDTEYFAMAYDCNSAAIIHNLTMGSFQMEDEEILQQKKGRIQLIQKKMEDSGELVTIYEIKVEQSVFVEQCGGKNAEWKYYHEILSHIELNEPQKMTKEEMKTAIHLNKIELGKEFGKNENWVKTLIRGTSSYKFLVKGKIKQSESLNYGYPVCIGEDYKDKE